MGPRPKLQRSRASSGQMGDEIGRRRCRATSRRRSRASEPEPGHSMIELIISRSVSSCIEMPGSTFQPPPLLSRMIESSTTIEPE